MGSHIPGNTPACIICILGKYTNLFVAVTTTEESNETWGATGAHCVQTVADQTVADAAVADAALWIHFQETPQEGFCFPWLLMHYWSVTLGFTAQFYTTSSYTVKYNTYTRLLPLLAFSGGNIKPRRHCPTTQHNLAFIRVVLFNSSVSSNCFLIASIFI